MTENTVKCAHPACTCAVNEGDEFCSQYCQDAGKDEIEISCDCAHAGCGLAGQPASTRKPTRTFA